MIPGKQLSNLLIPLATPQLDSQASAVSLMAQECSRPVSVRLHASTSLEAGGLVKLILMLLEEIVRSVPLHFTRRLKGEPISVRAYATRGLAFASVQRTTYTKLADSVLSSSSSAT